jgi:hypothetical protein
MITSQSKMVSSKETARLSTMTTATGIEIPGLERTRYYKVDRVSARCPLGSQIQVHSLRAGSSDMFDEIAKKAAGPGFRGSIKTTRRKSHVEQPTLDSLHKFSYENKLHTSKERLTARCIVRQNT